MKLTRVDYETLAACADWKAGYEVVAIRGLDQTNSNRKNVMRRLSELCGKGLLRLGEGNGTFRTTDAGRVALEHRRKGRD